jgi:chemotaxis protein CheD
MSKEIIVGVGTYHVAKSPRRLVCIGLGSCVAIVLHEKIQEFGGLAHAMLPYYKEGKDRINAFKYVDTSIYLMVDDLLENGGKKSNLRAKLVGGSHMFSFMGNETLDIGRRNIESAKDTLKEESIRIVAEDVGGNSGRTIYFDSKTGVIELKRSGRSSKRI